MLLDVNVLVALLWASHDHHERARRWLRPKAILATCPLVQLGFARISSLPMLGFAASPEHAFATLRRFFADPRHRFIPDDLAADERSLFTEDIRTANSVNDHYLAALARKHGLTLGTFDGELSRAFRHEPGLVELIP